jgi:threonyl-tRNA synthetase
MAMANIRITFPDGAVREYPSGVTVEDIAASVSPGLKKQAIAGKFNSQLVDLRRPLHEDGTVSILKEDAPEALEILRHTTTHVMAQAVKRLYGKVKLGVGPVIEEGFYYDMDLETSLNQDDLAKIEKEMQKIIDENLEIKREVVTREEAIALFTEMGDNLKLELIRDIPEGETLTLYRQGEFVDLCRGPHLPSTGKIKAFKLLSVAGAYWRGNSENQMLQRIYGTAFYSKKELEEHLNRIEEAKKRDHRKLGKELELFMFSEEAPGMPFYLPYGMIVRNELENFSRKLQTKHGYQEVRTPLMMNRRLWEQSGHWDHYHENMYFTNVDDVPFALKPMNCPGHMLIFKSKLRSYRDLPIRMAEFGQVHRHELSGALSGMTRVRTFVQDDAHIFVMPSQIESEIKGVIKLIDEMYQTFGFTYEVELSTRPEDSMGSDELWEQAEASLSNVLHDLNLDYKLNEGDGAFYGPKIDFHIKDALGRSYQCGTVQLDFQMPEKFDLTYIDDKNEKARPVVIHRAIYGSIDRFFGILIEHFGGAFPTWLAPVQVKVIPVASAHHDYAQRIADDLQQSLIRVEVDDRDEKLGYKIREAQTMKIPYMLVVGDKEREQNAVNVRKYGESDSKTVAFNDFKESLLNEIKEKK